MDELLMQIMGAMNDQAGMGGWAAVMGCFGVLLTFGVRLFKLLVPGKFEALKLPYQLGAIFCLAMLGTFAVALAAQVATGAAIGAILGKVIITAIGAGIAAIATHHATKPVGKKMDALLAEKYPGREPGLVRKAGSLLVDLPKVKPIND